MNKWIRTGDKVLVIAGNDKGRSGKVLSRSNDRITIQGVNMRKKHVKRTQENQTAQILDREAAIHISNVALCSEDGKPIKLKVKVAEDGSRDLVYKVDDKEVVLRSLKKMKVE